MKLSAVQSDQLLSSDLSQEISPLLQAGQDELNCCTAAFTQSQCYFTVADICFRQTLLIQRGEKCSEAGTLSRRDAGRVLISPGSFLKILDQFTVSK